MIRNAIITSASLSNADHGCLSSFLYLDYGNSNGQGFGGYRLASPTSQTPAAGNWIWHCLRVAEVDDWSKLPGRTIRARIEDDRVVAIGHITREIWFEPRHDLNPESKT